MVLKLLYLFFFILPFLFCNSSSTDCSGSSISPSITIQSNASIFWFRDSLLTLPIYPSTVHCSPGIPCGFAGLPDYSCTSFPDTIWGILAYSAFSPETLFCHSDTAWVLHDTTVYYMGNYFGKFSGALCSKPAIAYTKSGICYKFSSFEDKVRIRNSCFDTTFSEDFHLPRLPLDSQNGVWFETVDTFFCSAKIIDSLEGCKTLQDIKKLVQGI